MELFGEVQGDLPQVSSPSVSTMITPGLERKSSASAASSMPCVSGVFPAGTSAFTALITGKVALAVGLRLSLTLHWLYGPGP